MTNPACILLEAELTSEEAENILRVCGPRALLVCGQALAAWAVHCGVQPAGELSHSVTIDADLIGTQAFIENHMDSGGAHGGFGRWSSDVSRNSGDIQDVLQREHNRAVA